MTHFHFWFLILVELSSNSTKLSAEADLTRHTCIGQDICLPLDDWWVYFKEKKKPETRSESRSVLSSGSAPGFLTLPLRSARSSPAAISGAAEASSVMAEQKLLCLCLQLHVHMQLFTFRDVQPLYHTTHTHTHTHTHRETKQWRDFKLLKQLSHVGGNSWEERSHTHTHIRTHIHVHALMHTHTHTHLPVHLRHTHTDIFAELLFWKIQRIPNKDSECFLSMRTRPASVLQPSVDSLTSPPSLTSSWMK